MFKIIIHRDLCSLFFLSIRNSITQKCERTAFDEGISGGAPGAGTDGVPIVEFTQGSFPTRICITRVLRHLAEDQRVAFVARRTLAHGAVMADLALSVDATRARVDALAVDAGLVYGALAVARAAHGWINKRFA